MCIKNNNNINIINLKLINLLLYLFNHLLFIFTKQIKFTNNIHN